jgi:thioredoxin-like negative regulator of GroEL
MVSENIEFIERAKKAEQIFSDDRERGERLFKMLLAERPDDGAVHLSYGRALDDAGEMDAALEHFRCAVRECWDPAWKARARLAIDRILKRRTETRPLP